MLQLKIRDINIMNLKIYNLANKKKVKCQTWKKS